ncbi:hypothetical protein M3Y96_00220900 [Aphelenchoides besseyi]|nr:hypothetical protein M3Y96_00220900 [Aphelenchoides besseyi]
MNDSKVNDVEEQISESFADFTLSDQIRQLIYHCSKEVTSKFFESVKSFCPDTEVTEENLSDAMEAFGFNSTHVASLRSKLSLTMDSTVESESAEESSEESEDDPEFSSISKEKLKEILTAPFPEGKKPKIEDILKKLDKFTADLLVSMNKIDKAIYESTSANITSRFRKLKCNPLEDEKSFSYNRALRLHNFLNLKKSLKFSILGINQQENREKDMKLKLYNKFYEKTGTFTSDNRNWYKCKHSKCKNHPNICRTNRMQHIEQYHPKKFETYDAAIKGKPQRQATADQYFCARCGFGANSTNILTQHRNKFANSGATLGCPKFHSFYPKEFGLCNLMTKIAAEYRKDPKLSKRSKDRITQLKKTFHCVLLVAKNRQQF